MSKIKLNLKSYLLTAFTILALVTVFSGFSSFITQKSSAKTAVSSVQNANTTVRAMIIFKLRPTGQLKRLLDRIGIDTRGQFNTQSVTLDLPLSVVEELSLYNEVEVIIIDNVEI